MKIPQQIINDAEERMNNSEVEYDTKDIKVIIKEREIKGKVWHKKEKTFNDNIFTLHDCWNLDKDNDVFLQYTGLHDKNGKEIYEGDVVKSKLIGEENEGEIWEIGFNPFGGFVSPGGKAFDNSWREHEIIGNIYENPDLINQHK